MANEKRLIDANALSNSISGIGKDMKRPRAVELACLCLIAEATTIDAVEVIHAKWMLDKYGCGTCSNCNTTQVHVYDRDYNTYQKYCGECGAKMDGGKDNEID